MKRQPVHYDASHDSRFDEADHVFLITPTEEDPEGIEQALELLAAYSDRRIKLMRTVFADPDSGETEVEAFPLEILPECGKAAHDAADADFLWQIVEGLNLFTADVMLAILALHPPAWPCAQRQVVFAAFSGYGDPLPHPGDCARV